MTEVDAVELASTCAANSFTAFSIYISFTFGFLVMAFFVGSKLTRFQALVATGLYLIAAGAMALSTTIWLHAFFLAKDSNTTFLDTISLLGNGQEWIPGISILLFLGVFISLYFMWDVRHPKTK